MSAAPPPPTSSGRPRLVVVTGLSGAGKSIALQALEDAGFETVDNPPMALMDAVIAAQKDRSIAVGLDVRTRDFDARRVVAALEKLRQEGRINVGLVFVDADTDIIVQRYTTSRRPHPLATDRPITDGIAMERELLEPLREGVGLVIDTSRLAPADLKRIVQGQFADGHGRRMRLFLTSFAYRDGLPRDADLVFDVRFLKNPHYEQALRPYTGLDKAVGEYIAQDPAAGLFLERVAALLEPLLPLYEHEGKSYLTIAIGCTGGQHRSVYMVERLKEWFAQRNIPVDVRHRDMPRSSH